MVYTGRTKCNGVYSIPIALTYEVCKGIKIGNYFFGTFCFAYAGLGVLFSTVYGLSR